MSKGITLPEGTTLKALNETLEKAKTSACTYKVNITDTGKNITLHKATRVKLQEAGVNVQALGANGYISYNKHPQVYDAILALLKENSDIFSQVGA